MSSQTATDHHPERTYAAVLAAMAVAAAAGFWMSLTSRDMPGSEALTLEDGVDVVGIMLFGVLGIALVARDRAAGLGRALVLMASMIALDYFLHGLADAIAGGHANPPAAARILNIAGESAFVVAFFLLALSPLLLFPTGRLPSRRWRWAAGAGIAGCGAAVLSVLLAPGLVDEDVPAWGDNPIGLDAAPRLVDALEVVGIVLLAGGHRARAGGVRHPLGALPRSAPAADGVVHDRRRRPGDRPGHGHLGDSVTVEVLMALAIFGSDAVRHRLAAARPARRAGRGRGAPHVGDVRAGARPRVQLRRRSYTRHMSNDPGIHEHISGLIAEEKTLREQFTQGQISKDEEHARLQDLEVQLDQCWDLLRQRDALRATGQDPDHAEVRPPSVVENYRG